MATTRKSTIALIKHEHSETSLANAGGILQQPLKHRLKIAG